MRGLVLAGGYPQIALINELKSRDIYVVLADWNEEPVAKKYCDKYYRVSTLDVEAIRRVAIDESVDFIVTVCTDQALLTVAKVSEELGLPCYIDYQTALNVTNKAYMKSVFEENGISTAKHKIVDTFNPLDYTGWDFPLIVKPVDCNSSKGVKKVTNDNELENAVKQAIKLSRTNTAVVEDFVAGTELSVDVYVENGKANVLCISSLEKIGDKDKFVIFRGLCPAREAKAVEAKIQHVAQQIADAFKLKDSPMLIQLITDGKNVYVLEFSARTGGGLKYLRIQRTTGFDVIRAVVDLTLGEKPHYENNIELPKYSTDEFIYCKPGVFDHLEGFEECKNDGLIEDYYLFKWKGAVFDTIENSGDRICAYTLMGDSIEELGKKHNVVKNRIRVIDNQGNDMTRRDLLTDII